MLTYKLDELGWLEFEAFVQALLKIKLGYGVQAWGGRGDWGRDAYFEGQLRYPRRTLSSGPFLFQCKFVESANASGAMPAKVLVNAVRKECINIRERIRTSEKWQTTPRHYALLTNAPLTPNLRQKLTTLIQIELPKAQIHLHGGSDLCAWVAGHPDIVRGFPQLLSLSDIQFLLQSTVSSSIISRSEVAITRAKMHASRFYPTKAYYDAREILSEHGFVVLKGPPEMGKTTIGRMIALSNIFDGWEAFECASPEELLRVHKSKRKQVFVADDFFGRTEYEPSRVSVWQAELSHILHLINKTHWLILTSRAHLLEMAKSNLDIAGFNHKFPDLGEIVVDAGHLSHSEKARILYRHAKAADFQPWQKRIVKTNAPSIVRNEHFTPERIRRLVEDVIAEIKNDSEQDSVISKTLNDVLSDPTKQMRVSFKMLPEPHKWLLFSLLDSEGSLEARFQKFCPTASQRPFHQTLSELTEAFVTKSLWESIEWIHPSCRDLAIEILSETRSARDRFLSLCGRSGLLLATSVAGGFRGERTYPLLRDEDDWKTFENRAIKLLSADSILLADLLDNYNTKSDEIAPTARLTLVSKRLHGVLQRIAPEAARALSNGIYGNAPKHRKTLRACLALNAQVEVDLTEDWNECLSEAEAWSDSMQVVWQDYSTMDRIYDFLDVVENFFPEDFLKAQENGLLKKILTILGNRIEEELDRYSLVSNTKAKERESNISEFNEMAEVCDKLAEFAEKHNEPGDKFSSGASTLKSAVSKIEEDSPQELESDDSRPNPETEFVSVELIFSDL